MKGGANRSNRDMFPIFAAPYFAYVLIGAVPHDYLGAGSNYAVRIVLVGTLLAAFWKQYPKFTGPLNSVASFAIGAAAGAAAGMLWIAMVSPLAPAEGVRFSEWEAAVRICATVLIVPVFEELFIRRYVLAVANAWAALRAEGRQEPFQDALDASSAVDISPGSVGLAAAVVSTAAFTLGHRTFEWPAAVAFSLIMLGLWKARKDMVSLITAHGAANLVLGVYVVNTGAWNLW